MKNKLLFGIFIIWLSGCDEVRDLLEQSFETEITRDFELEIPEGDFTSQPHSEIWYGQLDMADNEFPEQVRNGVSDLFAVEIPSITLEVSDIVGNLTAPSSLWGDLTFSDPETGQELAWFELPEMQLHEEGSQIQVPLDEAMVDQLTSSLLSLQKIDYSMELLYSGHGPLAVSTELIMPMGITLQLF